MKRYTSRMKPGSRLFAFETNFRDSPAAYSQGLHFSLFVPQEFYSAKENSMRKI